MVTRSGGQGLWSRSGYRSWGQVGGGLGVKVGVKLGLGVKVGVKLGVMVSGQGQGHDRWTQRLGSRSGVNIVGSRSGKWSRSWGGGQCLADWGQMVDGGG